MNYFQGSGGQDGVIAFPRAHLATWRAAVVERAGIAREGGGGVASTAWMSETPAGSNVESGSGIPPPAVPV